MDATGYSKAGRLTWVLGLVIWPHWSRVHDLINMRLAIPRSALLSIAVAASPSKGVLEDPVV